MTCTTVRDRNGTTTAIVCGPHAFFDLSPWGAAVWCEWHKYLGPSFYRTKRSVVAIRKPDAATWAAFHRWLSEKGA